MERSRLSKLASHFLELHRQPEPLLLANVWDVSSARAVVAAGARALATTSVGVAESLGFADGQKAPAEEVLRLIRRIAGAVDLPVTADMEAGYGLEPAALAESLLDAGVIGLNIEDSDFGSDEATSVVDAGILAQRIGALRRAAEGSGVHVVINARIDVFLRHVGEPETRFAESVRRARIYRDAGADCVYPIGLASEALIEQFVAAVDSPVNILARPGVPAVGRLRELGVARVSIGGQLARSATDLVRIAAEGLFAGRAELCFPRD